MLIFLGVEIIIDIDKYINQKTKLADPDGNMVEFFKVEGNSLIHKQIERRYGLIFMRLKKRQFTVTN